MKRLRKLALNLNRRDWPNDYGYAFYLRSRRLCNFIERSLRQVTVHAVNAGKLCITGCARDDTTYAVNSSNVACLDVPFRHQEYDSLQTDEEVNAFIVRFMRSGLALIPPNDAGEVEPILKVLQEFEEKGYLNEWQHKSRSFRDRGLKVSLHCTLTISSFELHMEATNHNGITHRRSLLRTDPDEITFQHRFNDILLEDNHLVISSKISEPLCRIPLTELNH